MRKALVLLGILFFTGFEYGCTAAQRQELLKEGLDATKSYFAENAGKWKDAAVDAGREYVDKKLKEKETAELKALDLQLAPLAGKDEEGNPVDAKTWKSFDTDNSGSLEEGEVAKVAVYVTTQTTRKVASGEMSKDEAGKTAKQTGITLAALLAILLGKRGLDKFAGKKAPPPGQPAPPSGGPA